LITLAIDFTEQYRENTMLESGIFLQDRYEIIQPIGNGGMGAVYLARDQRLGNTVALKETFFNDSMMVAAFEREARLLAGLRHAALPKVMDHFIDHNGQFLVMEFIPGQDLQDLLQSSSKAFQLEEMLQWADQLLDALDYLHSQDPPVIHRDIKPQNLKLSSRNQIVLLDFGLAKNAAANNSTTTSGKSLFAYTPIYAPLEQIQGAGTDARSDIYSLGATLYHLLTGEKPVDALTRAGDFLNGKPDPLVLAHEKNTRISPLVSDVIAQAMALNRDLRPASAIVMRKLLRDAVQSPTDNLGNQGKTIMSQTRAFHANTDKGFSVDSTRISASQPLTYGQATPKTNANAAARQLATHQRPATPKYAGANSADKSPWATTPAWSHSQTQLHTQESSGKGKWVAAAVVFVVLSVILVLRFSGSSETEGEIKPTTPTLVEQQNVPNPTNAGTNSPATASQPQYQPSSSMSVSEQSPTQEQTPQRAAEEKPTAETATTQTAEPVATKQEPAKTEAPQTQPAPQLQPGQLRPDGKPYDPMREGDRRPPPHMGPPPPEGYPPPPHGGGPPPPDRRRP
jgi:eukaryotic-like serine/threonine-protein kinase